MKRYKSLLALLSLGLASQSPADSVIVNEINAGGATVAGDWFELVVVGDGTAGSTVDMRGWTLRVDNNGTIMLGVSLSPIIVTGATSSPAQS